MNIIFVIFLEEATATLKLFVPDTIAHTTPQCNTHCMWYKLLYIHVYKLLLPPTSYLLF